MRPNDQQGIRVYNFVHSIQLRHACLYVRLPVLSTEFIYVFISDTLMKERTKRKTSAPQRLDHQSLKQMQQ